jgi:hypothetical protein
MCGGLGELRAIVYLANLREQVSDADTHNQWR